MRALARGTGLNETFPQTPLLNTRTVQSAAKPRP